MSADLVVVLATDHPERDEWVDQQARAEAGGDPGPYQGTLRIPPDGALVHAFGDAQMVAAVRERWAAMEHG